MSKAPLIRRIPFGKKLQRYKVCPYSTTDVGSRIPTTEKDVHPTTSGYMTLDVRAGHDGAGWVCMDNNCPYFRGTAVTSLPISTRKTSINYITGEYTISEESIPTGVCSGTRYWEM